MEEARRLVLAWFGTDASAYTAIFTPNATGALKEVGEAYPFAEGGRFLATFDNHNSVNGVREFARAKGARVDYAPLTVPDLRIDRPRLEALLAGADRAQANLFLFPAQSNFSGVKHPLDLVASAQSRGWHVLLDAAAFVPTNRLDLGAVRPDFVTISFYKMFGYPTGVGCLLVRNETLPALVRPWFAGGTVNFASVQGLAHFLSPREAGFEDGTLNYLSIPAITIGLRHLERVGLDMVRTRVGCLTEWMLAELLGLCHRNGRPMVRIYGPDHGEMRGGTITFNLYDPDGHLLDYRRIEELATDRAHLDPDGMLLQPGRGRDGRGLDGGRHARGSGGGSRHDAAPLPAGHPAPRRKERGRHPRIARPRQQLRRRGSLSRVRIRVPRSDAADHRRGHVRCRELQGDTRRELTPELGNWVIG